MRVLFTVFAAKTHFFNLVPLAWALRAAGHEVQVASQPDLAEAITRAGLTAVPVGEPLNMGGASAGGSGGGSMTRTFETLAGGMIDDSGEPPTWDRALGAFTVACSVEYEYFSGGQVLDDLVEYARHWRPDLVVWDALTFSGAVAAKACGAAHARTLFGIDYVQQMYGHYLRLLEEQPEERRDDPVSDWLRGRLYRFGCDFDESSAREMLAGQWTIDPTFPGMQLPLDLPYVPVRYVPYNGQSAIPDWVHQDPGRPRVCLSLGMSERYLPGGAQVSIGGVLESLAELDIELVATLNADQVASVPSMPPNVRAVAFVPLYELLPTCAAVVHHGGFGTLGNVLVHGLPSVTVPAAWWDEDSLGRQLGARGAGIYLAPQDVTPARLAQAVSRVLDEPSFRDGALRLQSELRATPGPGDLVPELEELTERHRVRRPVHA
ncbi:activator-dependent family glycosyltransferase [Actinomadura rudentiformis]|uniref:Activator-dependent family glycosyltransferase n=1 Tax=Actinomadura rudentiformis TaxID=359158 RepID=A0A6H9YWP8_9ACTN|nr:activator-dependent family glycosyltransferase [Actinomadura rudentiformis]KAB2346149.1 activator-dependent family glycosyltransferase [Actinomadura rudentiformis]